MDNTYIILYIVLVALAFIVIILIINLLKKYNLRSMKNKNLKDDAYNKIESTKSIASILGKKGIKVGPAVAVLGKAEVLYKNGDYNGSISLADEAKRILDRAKLENTELPKDERVYEQPKIENVEKKDLDDETLSPTYQLQKKLPENYLAAKFSLEMAQNLYDGSEENKKIDAFEYLKMAKVAFNDSNYSESLKYSLKTQRILKNEEEKIEHKCPNCGAVVDPNDKFCWNCGYSLKIRKCPNCGADIKPDDKFCRSCGYKLV
ncbi:MAG: zinc ribbon domain-containing protein [Thermoplasmata archaeon]|nr:zinc ribbon domain-containing protein [Thermoplasmata archaeon]